VCVCAYVLVGWLVGACVQILMHAYEFFCDMNARRNEFVQVLSCPAIADPQKEPYIAIKQSLLNPQKKALEVLMYLCQIDDYQK